jgi:sphingolipid delta-4 desaturase
MATTTTTTRSRSKLNNNNNNDISPSSSPTNDNPKQSATLSAQQYSETLNTRSDKKNFTWSYSDEPHATRRRLILEKHPEIYELFGPEPLTLPLCFLIISIQIFTAYYLRNASWYILFICAYVIGGTLNHSLKLAVHELSHNLAFTSGFLNKLFALTCNLPTGVPSAITFQKYHMDHHQFQGVDGIDTDIPTTFEVNWFTNMVSKVFWVCCQPLFYALRPVLVKPKPVGQWEGINWIMCMSFNVCIYYLFGIKSLCYLVTGTLLGLGFHPSAGHFIAEHYEFIKGQETYSYYGFWNFFNFNVGYHNEHHDFPKVPWSRLPTVKKLAPEFYDNLPHYNSYIYVIAKYILDPEVGPFARIKRIAPSTSSNSNSEMDNLSSLTIANRKAQSPLFRIMCVTLAIACIGAMFYAAITVN